MPIVVSCPACQRALQIPEEFFGKTVQCPDCKHTFEASASSTGVQSGPAPTAPPPPKEAVSERPAAPRWADDDEEHDEGERPPSIRRRGGTSSQASMILTFGILGVSLSAVGTCCCILLTVCGLGLSIAGWIMGHTELKKIDQGLSDAGQRGTVQTGMYLSIAGVCVAALGFLISCGAFILQLSMNNRF
jgi:hypothetical protein